MSGGVKGAVEGGARWIYTDGRDPTLYGTGETAAEACADLEEARRGWDRMEAERERTAQRIHASNITMQEDLRALLRVLGLFDGARPESPHTVMRDEVIPAVERLVAGRCQACNATPTEPCAYPTETAKRLLSENARLRSAQKVLRDALEGLVNDVRGAGRLDYTAALDALAHVQSEEDGRASD